MKPLAAALLSLALSGGVVAAAEDWHPLASMASGRFQSGSEVTAGMTGDIAIYLKGRNNNPRLGGLRREIALDPWRGNRVRVSLRLKNEGDARAFAGVQIFNSNETGISAVNQQNAAGDAWEVHRFVLDVPKNARVLAVTIGLTGEGTVWTDDFKLEEVGQEVPLTASVAASGAWLSSTY